MSVLLAILAFLLMSFYVYILCAQDNSPTKAEHSLIEKRGQDEQGQMFPGPGKYSLDLDLDLILEFLR